MNMITAVEAANNWKISVRTVQNFCRQGKIPGAERFGTNWMIPADAPKPLDGRSREAKDIRKEALLKMPRKSPDLTMTDLYHVPGSAAKVSRMLKETPEAKVLFDAQIAYCKGQIEEALRIVHQLDLMRKDFYTIAGAGMLMAMCAIWLGDSEIWNIAKKHISKAPCKNEEDREKLALVITASDSSVFDYNSYPKWFEQGSFEDLHADIHPMTKVFYAKWLYMAAYAVASRQYEVEGVQGLALMRMIPNTIEPMITQAMVDKTVIPEIHLRLWCATAYHNGGNSELAIKHVDKAIALALPDQLYGILAEYSRTTDALIEERLRLVDSKAEKEVRELAKKYIVGQAGLGSNIRQRNIAVNLSPREREVAKLIAFGFTNKKIAKNLGIGESTVKTTVQNIMIKTGLNDRTDFVLVL